MNVMSLHTSWYSNNSRIRYWQGGRIRKGGTEGIYVEYLSWMAKKKNIGLPKIACQNEFSKCQRNKYINWIKKGKKIETKDIEDQYVSSS